MFQTAIAQISVSKSLITNHTEKILLSAYSSFQFLYNLNINSLLIVLIGGRGGGGFWLFFCLWLLLLLKKDFEGLINLFSL